MPKLNLKSLIGKLNPLCRKTLEGAAGLCLSRTNYNVEIEHWLFKLLEETRGDVHALCRSYEIDATLLLKDLTKAIDGFQTGNARPPALSQNVVDLVRDAWLVASVDGSQFQVRSAHLLIALLSSDALQRVLGANLRALEKINVDSLALEWQKICADTEEEQSVPAAGMAGPAAAGGPVKPTKTPALDQFTQDLTDRARAGKIDPVLGRDDEIRQIVDILCRRRQNNPILTGEAGVGKTAVVEGFALRIAAGDVPPVLKDVSLRSLDLALLQAGAGVKGEFENRLKSVIEEVKGSPKPIILFIDEAHNMIGAGGSAGQNDAANLLKPALARGELRTIAATTWAEYKKYFEKDAALARRFQVVKVEEPSEKAAVDMMRGLVKTLTAHHRVRILNEAVEDAVKLSSRYISGRQLPDKAMSLLDTTCARINLSQNSTPPAIEHCLRRIENLTTAEEILQRESIGALDHRDQIQSLQQEREQIATELEQLRQRWETEKQLVRRVNELYAQLITSTGSSNGSPQAAADGHPVASRGKSPASPTSSGPATATVEAPVAADPTALAQELESLSAQLTAIQGESPLVHACCDASAVAATVAAWTGIPVGRMVADEIKTMLNLKASMEQAVVGQSHALEQIAVSIQMSRAKLTDPSRPIGVFFLAGTSGVGKTETAITLAQLLYGGEQNMTVINMSEFKEEHKVSLLMGSPPGYVGYGEGGVLTEAVRRKPYSVLLLDEMEKAHPGVQDIFYQVFDKGQMKDGEGRDIDFRNTVIIMTSNAGSDLIKSVCSDPELTPEPEAFTQALYPELLKTFKPAFLGRVTIVPYYPLRDDVMKQIIRLKLGKVQRRVAENYKAEFSFDDSVVETIAARCTEVDTGARNVDKILNKTLLPELAAAFLARMGEGKSIARVTISVDEQQGFQYHID